MRRLFLMVIGPLLAVATPLCAGTFAPQSIAPALGVDRFTRAVSRQMAGRDLFANPYATVTISNVDLYDRFPYVESRNFQVVSDPRWNRLVYGEIGDALSAYDGVGTALGALSEPRGMAVDEQNRVYVADAGNDRIVVLQATTEFSHIDLVPLYVIGGLSSPYDVAYSDGGTPFQTGDDFLYVADTGRNRIVAFSLGASGAREMASLGALGSGPGRFAGPMAIAVGRSNGANTGDVYVADSHNRRIVKLLNAAGSLRWVAEAHVNEDAVTSLDTDQWGNVYAAAPQQNVVRKFNGSLEPVAALQGDLAQPRAVHIPFSNVHDHRDGSVTRVGQASAVSVDAWADQSGVRLWTLGVGVDGLGVAGGDSPTAHFVLTDQANVSLEVVSASDGRRVGFRVLGSMAAGAHDVSIVPSDLSGVTQPTDLMLRVSAASSYANGSSDVAQAGFRVNGGGVALPGRAMLLGNWPNPSQPATRISFILPSSGAAKASLGVFDASGRRVRRFAGNFSPGLNQVFWDGTAEDGRGVRPGLYFYRLDVDGASFTRRMVVVR